MASSVLTLNDMGKKKKPQGRSPAYVVYARIDPAIGAALDRYMESLEAAPSMKASLEAALKHFLKAKGFWPPPAPPEGEGEGE
jgi:hypothetical protein